MGLAGHYRVLFNAKLCCTSLLNLPYMSKDSPEDFALFVGYSVIILIILSVFFYLLYDFYYLFVAGSGCFASWILWQVASKEGKGKLDKTKNAFMGLLLGVVASTFLIGFLYGSKAPWVN